MTKIEKKMIIAAIIVIILFFISVSFLVKSCERIGAEIDNRGLKGVFEEVWEGKTLPNKPIDADTRSDTNGKN